MNKLKPNRYCWKPWLGSTENVLAFIIENPGFTTREISRALKSTIPAVKNATRRHRLSGDIVRNDQPGANGLPVSHWSVNPERAEEIDECFKKAKCDYTKERVALNRQNPSGRRYKSGMAKLVLGYIVENPSTTSASIQTALNADYASVKNAIWRLRKAGTVVGEKKSNEAGGPDVYHWSVKPALVVPQVAE